MQTGALSDPLPTDPSNNAEHFPFWNIGLDGTGQVVLVPFGLDVATECHGWV